jgi:hypothetical protein
MVRDAMFSAPCRPHTRLQDRRHVMRRCQALARSVLSMPASGQRPRRQRRLTDRERDGSSRSESFWARMHPQTQSGGTAEGGPRFWSQWMPTEREVLLEVAVLLRKMQEPLAAISKETRLG